MRITLCGSTRFQDKFNEWNVKLTLDGHVVYSLAMFGREATDVGKPEQNLVVTDEQKVMLDLVHLGKISNSDAIVVLNPANYVGFSTKREIAWARMNNKKIFWLERPRSSTPASELADNIQP